MVFSKAPKVVLFSKTLWLWSFSSWPKLQSYGLLFHGFFQSSQSHFLLPGRILKDMVFFFLNFSKAPKVVVFILVFPKLQDRGLLVLLLVIS